MNHFTHAAVLAFVSFAAGSASAQDAYVGINRTTPGEAYGGFNIDGTYAIEAGYGFFGTWKVANPAAGSKEEVRISSKMMYLAGKASMPLGERFSVFGKLGLASNKFTTEGTNITSSSTSTVRPMLGFGASASVTRNIAVVLEFNYYGKADKNYTQQKLEIGVQYGF
jgi:OOP family OmpA-OmpF porin